MKFNLIIVFTIVMNFNTVSSQNNTDYLPTIKNIPTTPEAALLGRFGEVPIGHYTGTAQISIPIYSIKVDNLDIPITLNYHSSGIKVSDEATWVGLGWDLSPQGTIIQEVRGNIDDNFFTFENKCSADLFRYRNFKSRIPSKFDDYYSLSQRGRKLAIHMCMEDDNDLNDDPSCLLDSLLAGEGQPDIFHYSFGNYSGKFYINPETKEIVLIDKKVGLVFERLGGNSLSGWRAKTTDGNVFYFEDVETTREQNISNDYVGATYKMSKIECSNKKTIYFKYKDEKFINLIKNETANVNNFSDVLSVVENTRYTTHYGKVLSKIETSEVNIDFNLDLRNDLVLNSSLDAVYKLKSIDISTAITNSKLKSFNFNYSYFDYNLIGSDTNLIMPSQEAALGKRLRLDNVQEIGYNQMGQPVLIKPAYKFEYDLRNIMPLKNSCAKDFWGYYNGQNNKNLLPDLKYFDFFNDPRYKVINQTLSYRHIGANRYTNNNFAGANLLKKITYPKGGFSEFEYEPNSFTNQFIPDKEKIDKAYKLNIIEDKNYQNDITYYQFHLPKTTTITFENTIYGGHSSNSTIPYNYQQMQGAYIELLKVDMTGGSIKATSLKNGIYLQF